MSRSANVRKATQLHACRAVLAKYLEGKQLEMALLELRDTMRKGPEAWAFKSAAENDPPDDRTYYPAGGNL